MENSLIHTTEGEKMDNMKAEKAELIAGMAELLLQQGVISKSELQKIKRIIYK